MTDRQTKKYSIGFIPVMAKLYKNLLPDLQVQLQQFSGQIGRALSDRQLEIKTGQVAVEDSEIRRQIRSFEEAHIDLLVIGHVSYCPSGEILPGLLKTKLPVLLWPAQPMLELSGKHYDGEAMIHNHGVHGTQDLANILMRNNRPCGVLHGHYRQLSFKKELLSWVRAGRAVTSMKSSRPLVLGGHFEQMLDLQLGKTNFPKTFGIQSREISLNEFIQSVKTVLEKDIKAGINRYRSCFELDKHLTQTFLEKTARHDVALRNLMRQRKSSAVGINFQALCNDPRIGDALHVAASLLMSDGLGYAGEGDWVTAMLVCGLRSISPRVTFTEIFSVGYRDNRLVLRHWGEGNFDLARKKPLLKISQFKDKHPAEFAVMNFEFKPGLATLVNLNVGKDGHAQILSIAGRIAPESLSAVDGPRGIFKPDRKQISELLSDYAYQGGSHHLVMVMEQAENVLDKISKLTGWRYVKV
ncbi:MAG: hypothetical protein WC975_03605 [Phycisphaerae bacterium]